MAVGVDRQQLERRARRIDDAAVLERGEGAVARIGDGIGRRRALDDEQPLADDRHIERLFARFIAALRERPEEHTSELQSLMRISYAVFCLKKNTSSSSHLLPHTLIHN